MLAGSKTPIKISIDLDEIDLIWGSQAPSHIEPKMAETTALYHEGP